MSSVHAHAARASDILQAHASPSDDDIFRPVPGFLPKAQSTLLDIGARTGRTASRLAHTGRQLSTVEPPITFRDAGQAQDSHRRSFQSMTFCRTRTAPLQGTVATSVPSGVRTLFPHHKRRPAMQFISRRAKPHRLILLTLHHGPAPKDITMYPANAPQTIAHALSHDLAVALQTNAPLVRKKLQSTDQHNMACPEKDVISSSCR